MTATTVSITTATLSTLQSTVNALHATANLLDRNQHTIATALENAWSRQMNCSRLLVGFVFALANTITPPATVEPVTVPTAPATPDTPPATVEPVTVPTAPATVDEWDTDIMDMDMGDITAITAFNNSWGIDNPTLPTNPTEDVTAVTQSTVDDFTAKQLKALAKGNLKGYGSMRKADLFIALRSINLV